jgi:protein phosphatase
MIKIDYACGTHPGLVRERNEDAYFADPELGLWLIADGMGGHRAGEVASGIVVKELPAAVRQGETLADAIDRAHMMIQMASEQVQGTKQMGSTVVALKLEDLRYEIAWVGDSRAYLWNGFALSRLTKDHTYVQLLLDFGMIMEEDLFTHPSRNVICQGLGVGGGVGDSVKVDEVQGELSVGDTLLLCSDGLCGEVRDEIISEIMSATLDNRERLGHLMDAALGYGGSDNITVILVTPVWS